MQFEVGHALEGLNAEEIYADPEKLAAWKEKYEKDNKDPRTAEYMAAQKRRLDVALGKLQNDWQMREFLDDLEGMSDKVFEKYKDNAYVLKRLWRATNAGMIKQPSEPSNFELDMFGSSKVPAVTPGDEEYEMNTLDLTHGPLLSRIGALGYKVALKKELPLQGKMLGLGSLGGFQAAQWPAEVPIENPKLAYELRAVLKIPEKTTFGVKLEKWLSFSAGSVPLGNVGQANYVGANAHLHSLSCCLRTAVAPAIFTGVLMWGGVGGVGMRWKAFASMDAFAQFEGMLFTLDEASSVERALLNFSIDMPEQVGNMYQPSQQEEDNLFNYYQYGLQTGMLASKAEVESFQQQAKGPERGIQTPAIMALGDPDNRLIEVDDTQMQCGEEPYVGVIVTIKRMRKTPEFNGLHAELVESLEGGKFMAKLDDEEVENLMANGYVKPEEEKPRVPPYEDDGELTVRALEAEDYCIAGNWDEFRSQPMKLDPELKCFKYYLHLKGVSGVVFHIARGEATGKKSKNKGKSWTILSDAEGDFTYEIKVFLKSLGAISKVEWTLVPDVPSLYLAHSSIVNPE